MSKTVLIVDDEDSLRKTLTLEFKANQWTVFDAHHIDLAYKIIESEKIDLVLTDNRMPGGTGFDLLIRIKKAYRNLPVILMTGFSDVNWESIYDSGADAFLMKPFKLAGLISIAEKLLLPTDMRLQLPPPSFDPAQITTLERTFSDWLQAEREGAFMLGRGGFFLQMNAPLPREESLVKIAITLENGILRRLEGIGKVKWCRFSSAEQSAGIGVEFVSLAPESAKEVSRTIDMLQPQAFIPMGSKR